MSRRIDPNKPFLNMRTEGEEIFITLVMPSGESATMTLNVGQAEDMTMWLTDTIKDLKTK